MRRARVNAREPGPRRPTRGKEPAEATYSRADNVGDVLIAGHGRPEDLSGSDSTAGMAGATSARRRRTSVIRCHLPRLIRDLHGPVSGVGVDGHAFALELLDDHGRNLLSQA